MGFCNLGQITYWHLGKGRVVLKKRDHSKSMPQTNKASLCGRWEVKKFDLNK